MDGLRPRAQGIMDFIGSLGADLLTPPQASPVLRGSTPLQQAMGRPEVQFSQPSASAMVTTMPDGTMAMASPTPRVQAMALGQNYGGMQDSQMPTPPQVTPARQIPDMGGAGVRMNQTQLAEQAAKAVELERRNPEVAADPGFMKTVSDFFGDRENMLRLALAFNSMRYQPDSGLASVIGDELQDLRKTRIQGKTVGAVVSFLRAKGYDEYAKVVEQNPALASSVYEQVIQKELKPGATAKTSGVQYDAQNRAFVNVSEDGMQKVEYLKDASGQFITRQDPTDVRRLEKEWDISIKRSDEIGQKASGLESNLMLFQQALTQLNNGAESGLVISRLPAFDAQTAALRSIAQQLGIQTINSATFGALSEKELELALSTNMNLSLKPEELRKQIIEKMEATQKLYLEMRKKAAEMSSMPWGEYSELQKQRAEENAKYLKKPEDVNAQTWYAMTLDQKKRFYEAGQ